jgi:hypothetical protein
VDFLDPLNPVRPAEPQPMTLPVVSDSDDGVVVSGLNVNAAAGNFDLLAFFFLGATAVAVAAALVLFV